MMMKALETEKHDVTPYGFELVLDLHGCRFSAETGERR